MRIPLSDDETALINGVKAKMYDPMPKLVYADWLDDRGRELESRFIRECVDSLEGDANCFLARGERYKPVIADGQ